MMIAYLDSEMMAPNFKLNQCIIISHDQKAVIPWDSKSLHDLRFRGKSYKFLELGFSMLKTSDTKCWRGYEAM